jgi:glycosidase
MHINSPTLQEHPDWHTDSILPDGRRNFELWDEARLTTWFDKHIPTLDLEREEVCEAMTDSALYWLANYELDGFRHDACKHIPEGYWRMLGQKIASRWPGRPIWMIGETYGSPELIGSYVKTGMLNAQFDFNVYFTTREALMGLTGMDAILTNELTSLATYGGHHTMGNISGNHDQIRFASIAGGAIDIHSQGKEEGWTREVGIGDADKAYKRALLLEVINMTLPGVPCIYQGDEYGEVGGNDPDNRHMMRFDALSLDERNMRDKVAELIALRRSSMPLLYGDFIPLIDRPEEIVYQRVYLGEKVTVIINRTDLSYQIIADECELCK